MTAPTLADGAFRARAAEALRVAPPLRTGQVRRVVGLTFEVDGIDAAIGDAVLAGPPERALVGEVVAITERGAVAMPLGAVHGLRAGDRVVATGRPLTVPVGNGLLGRVLDGLGRPIDGGPPLAGLEQVTIDGTPPHPLRRAHVDQPVHLGVRALDALVPVGRGQRIGIFAGSGVGKSSLLSMIVRGTDADISVVALVGERGREVREFIESDLGPEGLARSVVIVATSDSPALVRSRAAFVATRIAEWFRDQGRHVNLLMDSLTRFAMAEREIGLSAGEVPATRGYPPSVFGVLPKLLERAGAGETGSVTGIYTVLVEADDLNDPIGDASRSILDGHIALTRRLATAGHFPSIDVLDSISRVAPKVTSRQQQDLAAELRRLLAAERDARDLIEIGAYRPGTNPDVDRGIERKAAIEAFLRQRMDERTAPGSVWPALAAALGYGEAAA
ncbi:MAG TPA: FliI/YscN family ATPase [Acidimicrobiales bacterium]|nr:FliI/YscN family ATPase [Acidimicrobiales bacterium]